MEVFGTIDQASLDSIDRNLKTLSGPIVDNICFQVLKEVSTPILNAAVDFCPVGNPAKDIFAGLLKASIDMKAKKFRGGAYVVIGPARKRSVETGKNQHYGSDPKRKFSKKFRDTPTKKMPTRYAHFVEFGTSHSSPQPFMRPAWDVAGGAVALEAFVSKFEKRLSEEVAKLPNTP